MVLSVACDVVAPSRAFVVLAIHDCSISSVMEKMPLDSVLGLLSTTKQLFTSPLVASVRDLGWQSLVEGTYIRGERVSTESLYCRVNPSSSRELKNLFGP